MTMWNKGDSMGDARRNRLMVACIVLLVFLLYQPSLSNSFVWDDDLNILLNPSKRNWDGLLRTWIDTRANQQYYPLTHSVWWVQYRLFGEFAFPYHSLSVLLHAILSVQLFFLLKRLAAPGAYLAAIIFAVHPINVETVAWITEQKNLLSGVLMGCSTLAFLRFAGNEREEKRPVLWYALSLTAFAAALLAKTTAAMLAPVLAILAIWKADLGVKRLAAILAPYFVLGMAAGSLTAWLEVEHVGAGGEELEWSLAETFIIAGRAAWFYASKIFWPHPIIFIYPRWEINTSQVWQFLFPLSLPILLGVLWLLRGELGRGVFVAALCYGALIFPALGFFDVYYMIYSFVQDHFAYHAAVPVMAVIAAALTCAARPLARRSRVAANSVLALVPVLLAMITWNLQSRFADEPALYRHTISHNKDAWLAHYNLANILFARGELDSAEEHFGEAIRIRPNDPRIQANFGTLLLIRGRTEESERLLRASIATDPNRPAAHQSLGLLLEGRGSIDEALTEFEASYRIDRNAKSGFDLVRLLVWRRHANDAARAIGIAVAVLEREPLNYRMLNLLGHAHRNAGNREASAAAFKRALDQARQAGDEQAEDEAGRALRELEKE